MSAWLEFIGFMFWIPFMVLRLAYSHRKIPAGICGVIAFGCLCASAMLDHDLVMAPLTAGCGTWIGHDTVRLAMARIRGARKLKKVGGKK